MNDKIESTPKLIKFLEYKFNLTLEKIDINTSFTHESKNNIFQIDDKGRVISLRLRKQSVSDLSFLTKHTDIENLDLSFNNIDDLRPLKRLIKLKSLWLSNNALMDRILNTSFMGKLSSYISGERESDLTTLANLKELELLDLSNNKVSSISFLKGLSKLNYLNISNNLVYNLSPIENLKNINYLNLSNNRIRDLKPILDFIETGLELEIDKFGLKGIDLTGNSDLISPPIEIVKQGRNALLRYFNRIDKEGSETIFEAKITLVGEGNAGKTTLLKKLLNPMATPPKKDERTRGILIADWEISKKNDTKYIAHIWDFGGQDVYYPVHRFFLTENSVFILLASTRQNSHEFNYWIPTIFQFGGKSPIILAQTCHDGNIVAWNDIGAYVANENFNIIKDSEKFYHELDLLNNNYGLEKIRKSIIDQIFNLPHIHKKVPKSWIVVRKLLGSLQGQNCLSYGALKEKIQARLPTNFRSKEDFDDCIAFFHSIGILLWYNNENSLKEWVILNPKWAVDAVYKIIDDAIIQKQKGIVFSKDFSRVWNEDIYENSHDILKKMLEVFKISFPKKSNKIDFILPTRLESMPSDKIWKSYSECLHMEYKFDFMPKGMINQISAELSRFITSDNEVWNNGVNFISGSSTAQAIEDFYNRKIIVRAKGNDARSLMLIFMNAVKDISDGYKGVKAKISIPCTCSECQNNEDPTFFQYDKLLKKIEINPYATITCEISDEVFIITELLFKTGLPNPVEVNVSNPPSTSINRKISIFLVSSKEMEDERKSLREFISVENDVLKSKGIYIEIIQWEYFNNEISITRLQDEYNKALVLCDIVLCLFFTKVGKYSEEEFDSVYKKFKTDSKPKIWTYFKDAPINTGTIRKEILTLLQFKEKLNSLGHFCTDYRSTEDLHLKLKRQLEKHIGL